MPAMESDIGVMSDPCAVIDPPPATRRNPSQATHARARMADGQRKQLEGKGGAEREDFAGHCRYKAENAALPAASAARVVLFGDSITELWQQNMRGIFNSQFLDRGISGQTSAQMLVRFRQDVIELAPAVVVIMAGTNDLAGNTGPTSLAWVQQNIATMAELAKAHGIRVMLASIPPAKAFGWQPGIDPRGDIGSMNAWLQAYAARQCLGYVDYHAVLVAKDGGMRPELTGDGVHPTQAGYRVMWPVLERALASRPRCGK